MPTGCNDSTRWNVHVRDEGGGGQGEQHDGSGGQGSSIREVLCERCSDLGQRAGGDGRLESRWAAGMAVASRGGGLRLTITRFWLTPARTSCLK